MKKFVYLFLFLLFVPVLFSCTANLDGETTYITDYYKKHEVSTFWDVTALCYADENLLNYNIEPFHNYEPSEDDYSGISGKVIGLKMLENSGYDISGYNIEKYISLLEKMTSNDDASGYNLPILQRLFGIYALKLSETDYGEDKIENYARHIISLQHEDGGFSAFSGQQSDVDTTAFIVPLLVYFKDVEGFSDAVSKASSFLRKVKNKDDTYSSFGTPNSNSTASALSALMALGFTEKDDEIGDISLALATFRLADGSYSYKKYGNTDMLSCAQALIAYRDFSNHTSLWLSILKGDIEKAKEITLSVVGPDDTLNYSEAIYLSENETAFDALKKFCEDKGLSYKTKGKGSALYLTSVNGLSERANGPESGWIYTVNAQMATVGCNAYIPKENDLIEFKYITEYEGNI